MNTKFFNEIAECWAIGEYATTVAKELGITKKEVLDVYAYQDAELEKYFEQQRLNELTAPEDEDYYEVTLNWSKP